MCYFVVYLYDEMLCIILGAHKPNWVSCPLCYTDVAMAYVILLHGHVCSNCPVIIYYCTLHRYHISINLIWFDFFQTIPVSAPEGIMNGLIVIKWTVLTKNTFLSHCNSANHICCRTQHDTVLNQPVISLLIHVWYSVACGLLVHRACKQLPFQQWWDQCICSVV